MATKKGILSDANFNKNCLDYKALPVGFANAEFLGSIRNPFLDGVKTPKYQRSAPKPASADVVAVNNSNMFGGNRAVNARAILDQYQKEAKEWKPPPVSLSAINRNIKDEQDRLSGRNAPDKIPQTAPRNPPEMLRMWGNMPPAPIQAVNPQPQSSSGVTRGDLMTKQTIGQRADPTINQDRLIAAYASVPIAK